MPCYSGYDDELPNFSAVNLRFKMWPRPVKGTEIKIKFDEYDEDLNGDADEIS